MTEDKTETVAAKTSRELATGLRKALAARARKEGDALHDVTVSISHVKEDGKRTVLASVLCDADSEAQELAITAAIQATAKECAVVVHRVEFVEGEGDEESEEAEDAG